ncbi:MAG: hypothetical protein ACYTG5_01460 [Planctomycetota bacterium]
MRIKNVTIAICLSSMGLAAQSWSVEELRNRSRGFQEESLLAKLQQVGALVEQKDQATAAICAAVHGDHREYLMKIERLLDQLADDRWFIREEAERSLVETGARAISLIEKRSKDGATLEERIRSQRIRIRIADRGTEEEERDIRFLRGWVATAAYLEPSDRLTRSLLSAVGHTDPLVVQGAIRSLGVVGGERAAEVVQAVYAENPGSQRLQRTALAALARMPGAQALKILAAMFAEGKISTSEGVAIVRSLKNREDAVALLDQLSSGSDPVLAACAVLPTNSAGSPENCRLTMPSQIELQKPFLGVGGDHLRIDALVKGMPRSEVQIDDCDLVAFDHPQLPLSAGDIRLFMGQGSLLTGSFLGLNGDSLEFISPVFGKIQLPRSKVQGLAMDAQLERLVGASGDYDRLRLQDGSFLDGRITAISQESAELLLEDGSSRKLPISEVSAVLLKRPAQSEQDPNLYTRVDTVGGDRLLIHLAFASQSHLGVVSDSLGSAVLPLQKVSRLEFNVGGGALWGFTLIADYSENQILEVDDQGEVVWFLDEVFGCWDVECLDNGNLLVTEYALNRVMEVDREGREIWTYEQLKSPNDADRLENGNTLIADTYGERVVEVNMAGEVVWEYSDQIKPFDVERLANGNTLIADDRKDRVIEIDVNNQIVWQLKDLSSVHDVDRLPNGNTLITLRMDHKVIEVDPSGNVVFTIEDLDSPSDADRLPNGHTLVAENSKVREFDRQGKVVWERAVMWAVEVNRY